MKKWLIPGAGVVAATAAIIGTLALAGAFDGGNGAGGDGAEQARCRADAPDCEDPNSVTDGDGAAEDDGGTLGMCAPGVTDCVDTVVDPGGDVSGICIEGTVDCVDTPLGPDGGAAGGTCLEGTVDCVDTVDPDKPVSNEPNTGSNPGPPPEDCSADLARCQEQLIAVVTEDLASRTGDAVVLSAEYVEWPDTSLGNPGPDMFYAQVITPGFKIILEAGGETYEYHTDTAGGFTLVE